MRSKTRLISSRPIIFSRPIIRLKTKQDPKKEVERVVYEEMCYTTKDLNESVNSFNQNSEKYVWECILRVSDCGGRIIKLYHAVY